MPSIKGVTLEQIEQEYRRPKAIPTTMIQVADMVGLDYIEMMDFIRDNAPDFDFHVVSQENLAAMGIPAERRGEYLLDYYLGSESSMVSIAIIFGYSTDKAVRRTIKLCPAYSERVKGRRKRAARERMCDHVAVAPAATMMTDFTIYEINRIVMQFCDAKLPIFTEWVKVGTKYYSFYPPIYKKMANLALERDASIDDLIASAILKIHFGQQQTTKK